MPLHTNEIAVYRPRKLARNMAEAYIYAEEINLSSITCASQLECLGIRELKALARKFNDKMGLVITKAKFGITYSQMRKHELINAMIEVRAIQLACPRGCRWSHTQLSQRLWEGTPDLPNAQPWVHYVAYDSEQLAFKFHSQMQQQGLVKLAALRPGTDRTNNAPWEVKCWGLSADIVQRILAKDTPLSQQAPTAPPKPKPKSVPVAPAASDPQMQFNIEDQVRVWQSSINTLMRCKSTIGLQAVLDKMLAAGYELSTDNKIVPVPEPINF